MDILIGLTVCAAIGYFIGNISPSYIIGRIKGYDVRTSGSKNAGASNTVIMAGKLAGLFVAVFDICKATISWKLAAALLPTVRVAGAVGGVACVLGHMSPVMLNFRGGKGFACMGGMALAVSPKTFLIMLGVALLVGLVTNYVAVSCATMSMVWPVYYGLTVHHWLGAAVLAIPIIPIFYKHRENFLRIHEGTEMRLSFLWQKERELERLGYNDD